MTSGTRKRRANVGLQTGPPHVGQGDMEEKGRPLQLVGGMFNNQVNLHVRLILGDHKMSSSPHLLAKILEVYIEDLIGFGHLYHPDGLKDTLLAWG